MSKNILATWEVTTKTNITSVIVPDGCQDLIMYLPAGDRPHWFVSPLFDETHTVTLNSNSTIMGLRIRPGTRIDEANLLASMPEDQIEYNDIGERLDAFTTCKNSTKEALNNLADAKTVKQAANEIGTTPRTLQRLVMRETGRPPVYWIMLARARKAARALNSALCLAGIAERYGYADQAHMCREFKRWFNASPSVLRNTPSKLNRLADEGYDGAETGVHSSIKNPFMSET